MENQALYSQPSKKALLTTMALQRWTRAGHRDGKILEEEVLCFTTIT